MINLIPNQEKKEMSKDFYFRLITVFFMMLGVSVFIAVILILPSYVISSEEKNFFDTKLEVQKNEPIPLPDQNTLTTIKDLKNKLNLIENAQKDKATFSQRVINEIILKKMPNIKITEISYENDSKKGELINISGKAPSREVLLTFRRALEDDPTFSKVNLPISNFIKGSNIRFNLSLSPL
jgi:hypothetical protein